LFVATSFRVKMTADPSAFLAEASGYLQADPLLTTVVSTVTHRAVQQATAGTPPPDYPRWWAVVRDHGGEIAGVAMRTAPFPPHPLFVLGVPIEAAAALAGELRDRGEEVRGVNGSLPAASSVASEIARLCGGTVRTWEHTRLYELKNLIPPSAVPGSPRFANGQDLELCLTWFAAFHDDAAEQAGRDVSDGAVTMVTEHDLKERISELRVLLWEVHGRPVHLCGFNAPSFGVSRVGPVYTPREHRGSGYASAGVAEVSRRLLAEGSRVCLYTDQANPTSNKIYRALGFEPVVDMANFLVE